MGARIARAPSYLFKNRHIFYVRIVAPVDLRPRLGRSELRYSLGTAYLIEARAKVARGTVVSRVIFNSIRKGAGTMAALTQEKIMTLVGEWLRQALKEEEDRRTHRPRPLGDDHLENHLEFLGACRSNGFREAV